MTTVFPGFRGTWVLIFLAIGSLALPPVDAGEEGKVPVAILIEEGARLAEEARAGYDRAHRMAPCQERNDLLTKVQGQCRASLDRYQLALEADSRQVKAVEAMASELTSMISWCEKNRGEIAPSTSVIPSPKLPPTASGMPLPKEEEARLDRLCRDLDEAFGKVRDCREQAATYRGRIQEISEQVDAARFDIEANPMNWPTVKIGEAKRESLMDKAKQNQKLIDAKSRESRSWEEKIRVSQSQVDVYGERAFPFLVNWTRQCKVPPTPEMTDYLARQLAKRQFSFTPVPEAAGFPAEADIPPARAQETRELLDLLLKFAAQAADLESTLADTDAVRTRTARELSEMEAHWSWRQKSTAWSPKEFPILKKRMDDLRRDLAGLDRAKASATEGRLEARKRLDVLKARLESLDPSQARVVENWRRARKVLPAEMEALLEVWIRKSLKG